MHMIYVHIYMYTYMNMYIYIYSLALALKRIWEQVYSSSNKHAKCSAPGFYIPFSTKSNWGYLKKIPDSRAEAEVYVWNILLFQEERKCLKNAETWWKDTELSLMKPSLAKSGTIWPLKEIMIVKYYNPLNKIENHVHTDINKYVTK